MDLNRFEELLDAHGPGFGRWPDDERAAAKALLAASDVARVALEDSTALDRALSEPLVMPASPLLRSAILDIPEIEGRPNRPTAGRPALGGRSPRRRGLSAGWMAIAASAAIGFAVGLWWPAEPAIWQSEDLVALVYGAPELDEVLR